MQVPVYKKGRPLPMNWTMDKSLKLSRVCVAVFSVLLAALCISGPWFWKAVLHRENIAWLYLAVTYSTAVPAALVLLCLHRLLKNISQEDVFCEENVWHLRTMSWCCIAAGLVYFAAGWFDWYLFVFAAAAAFVGLMLRVVKNVFAQAVAIKAENDYTI